MVIRCKNERQYEETGCCRNDPGSEFSRICKETCRSKSRHQRRGRLEVTLQVPHISCLRSTPRESLLELAKTTQTQSRRQHGRPRCESVEMVNVSDCHSTSRSSSWKRLFGKCTFNPKSETNSQCDKKVGQGLERCPKVYPLSIGNKVLGKGRLLLTDRAVRLSSAKAYVFSKSVWYMLRISENPASAWKKKIDGFMNSSQCRELDRIDGEPMEFG